MNRLAGATLALALSLGGGTLAGATTISDFAVDFSPSTPGTGWAYLWNSAGPLGSAGNYVPLVWNTAFGGIYAVSASVFPSPVEGYAALSNNYSHPGPGAGVGLPFPRYVIGAYTVQAGEGGLLGISGVIEMLDSARLPDKSDGLDLVVLLGNNVVSSFVVPISVPFNFATSLGPAAPGDTAYVAIGPRANELYDAFRIEYRIDSEPVPDAVPEPASLLLLASGVLGLTLRRRT